jgi:hypothetical protein
MKLIVSAYILFAATLTFLALFITDSRFAAAPIVQADTASPMLIRTGVDLCSLKPARRPFCSTAGPRS